MSDYSERHEENPRVREGRGLGAIAGVTPKKGQYSGYLGQMFQYGPDVEVFIDAPAGSGNEVNNGLIVVTVRGERTFDTYGWAPERAVAYIEKLFVGGYGSRKNPRQPWVRDLDEQQAIVDFYAKERDAKALTVPCPTCGAHPGGSCFTQGFRSRYTKTHRPRYRLGNSAKLLNNPARRNAGRQPSQYEHEHVTVQSSFDPSLTIDFPLSPHPVEIPGERGRGRKGRVWDSTHRTPKTSHYRKRKKDKKKRRQKRAFRGLPNPRQSDVSMYQDVLAHLRALQWSYTTTHWISAGPNAYGDHLLLERLYKGLAKPIDGLGERMVAYFGPASVHPSTINSLVQKVMFNVEEVTQEAPDYAVRPLSVLGMLELRLQDKIKTAWKANQDSGDEMSLGIDDFLMSLANERDEAVYLLKQRLSAGNR